MSEELMLSIYVATYGHEKYIEEAIESILKQKTKYNYEILVGEDASPDNTREILKKYEKNYPDIFRIFYRDTNMRLVGLDNANDLRKKCRGKYIIALEGDDFWIDEEKIELQINFLEKHKDYVAVAHNCVVVDEDSMPNGEKYNECKDEVYTLEHFVSEIMPGQLTTVMYRNFYLNSYTDVSILEKGLSPGDRLIYFVLACYGKIYCIQECKSAYRHIVHSGSSFSANFVYDYTKQKEWSIELINYAKKINSKKGIKYSQVIYFRNLVKALKTKQISITELLMELKNNRLTCNIYFLYLKQLINHRLLKKDIWL